MTKAEIKDRNEFADVLESVAKLSENVPSGGFDVPPCHIAAECRRWASCYRRIIPGHVERGGTK